MKQDKKELQEIIEHLRKEIPEGTTVYTAVSSVARSGMSRRIKAYTVQDGAIVNHNWHIAKALDEPLNSDGIKVNGCGMDMCFDLVYRLSRVLYGDGRKLNQQQI